MPTYDDATYHDRIHLHGLDVDLVTLKSTNHGGVNDGAIRTLVKVRADLLNKITARGGLPPSPPMRVSLSTSGRTVVAIVQNSGEMSALFARWVMRHPGAGMIGRKVEPREYNGTKS